jgi:hypothetical protein
MRQSHACVGLCSYPERPMKAVIFYCGWSAFPQIRNEGWSRAVNTPGWMSPRAPGRGLEAYWLKI